MPDFPERKFFETLYEFIENLRETFPEYDSIKKVVGIKRNTKTIRNIVDRLADHDAYVKTQDDSLFKDEPVYLLPGVNFTTLWKHPGLTQVSKTAIWQYLNVLLFTGNMIVNDGVVNTEDAAVAEFMKTMKRFTDLHTMASPESTSDQTPPPPQDSADIPTPSTGSVIESLANELAGELKLPENLQDADPMQLFKGLMSDQSNIVGILSKAGDKLKGKIDSGEVTEQGLMQEAQQMLNRMSSMTKDQPGMPDIGKLMQSVTGNDNINPADLMKNLTKMMGTMAEAGGSGSASNPMALLSGLMGNGDDEMPDLDELQSKVRKEMRQHYKQQQESAGKSRSQTQADMLRLKLKAKAASKQQ